MKLALPLRRPSSAPRAPASAPRGPTRGVGAGARPRQSSAQFDAAMLAESSQRAGWVRNSIVGVLALLFARASWLMVIPDERLEERGRTQFQSAVEMRGKRGALLDRNDRLLAYTVSLPALYANPSKILPDQLSARLGAITALTGRSEAWVSGRFSARNAQDRPLQEIRLGGSLDPAAVRAILNGLPRDVMWMKEEPVRMYPGKAMASPLLGFTDAQDDGAAGLEKLLQHELAGDTYRVLQAHDRKGRAIEAGVDDARLRRGGHSVRLTLDAAIQYATEEALDAAMVESRAEAAMAVVMDVRTGAILAMASTPGGNPNDNAARADQVMFKNRSSMDQIEPGSVMKPFISAAALEEGLVTPATIVDCELGAWSVGGRTIHDDHKKGAISVTEVIKYSSNIGAAKLGFQLGAVKVFQYLKDFGFGRSTGLGLPGDVSGSMRDAATVRTIELATTSFGQGMTASPVQLAAAVATIANGGVRMTPMLIDAVLDRDGQVETRREPRIDRRVVSEETARITARMLETVSGEGGTGTRARVDGYRVAGKTGTAQKVENGVYSATKRISSYVGFVPADNPVLAIAIVVDTPTVGSRYGGIVAAPAFASIATFSMRYLGVPRSAPAPTDDAVALASTHPDPDAPVLAPVAPMLAPPDPEDALLARAPVPHAPIEIVADAEGRWILPDLRGRSLREALAGLAPAGLELRVDGFGRLIDQSPAAGTAVAPGTAVSLRFN